MRKEIQFRLKQLGVVKPHVAIFVIKDLLGDQAACSSQIKKEILERLNTAISCREDIIVDLRKNNGATPKFDEFWEVILFRLLVAKIFISFMITAYSGLSQPRTQGILRFSMFT